MTDQVAREAIQQAMREFVRKEVVPRGYSELEGEGLFPTELLNKLAELGILGMSVGEKYGGLGADAVVTSMVARELAYGWPSLHLVWSANSSLSAFPIEQFGSEKQKRAYLPALSAGNVYGCYALTEPDAGSDVASMRATARFDEKKGMWVLNGTKVFITNASQASTAIIFARVGKRKKHDKRHEGITAFIYHTNNPGLDDGTPKSNGVRVRELSKWGLLAAPFCEITFEDTLLPEDAILGEVGKGFGIAMETLNNGRINIAAQAVGIASRALHEATEYARGREQFDSPLLEKQAVYHALADIKTRIAAAWALTLQAAEAKDAGGDYREEASQAKLFASEIAVEAALYAYRIYGGAGYTTETIVMRILHDALATVTYEGASNIQREVIAKSL